MLLDQGSSSHLHDFIAPKPLCHPIASLSGGGACGYDGSMGVPGLGHAGIAHEPASYDPMGSNSGCSLQGHTIFAPHIFIDAHHFRALHHRRALGLVAVLRKTIRLARAGGGRRASAGLLSAISISEPSRRLHAHHAAPR